MEAMVVIMLAAMLYVVTVITFFALVPSHKVGHHSILTTASYSKPTRHFIQSTHHTPRTKTLRQLAIGVQGIEATCTVE